MHLVTCDNVIWCDWYVTTSSSYPNYSFKNRNRGNLKRKGERKWKWKGNENNVESPAFSLDINTITIKNKHLLPLISKLVTKLQEGCYFTKLDAYWRFNNVHIKSGNEWKTVFYTNHRLFELLVIFFSMTNNFAIFQTMINDIFWNLIVEDIMIVYLGIKEALLSCL